MKYEEHLRWTSVRRVVPPGHSRSPEGHVLAVVVVVVVVEVVIIVVVVIVVADTSEVQVLPDQRSGRLCEGSGDLRPLSKLINGQRLAQ